jgi:hypothetical protein
MGDFIYQDQKQVVYSVDNIVNDQDIYKKFTKDVALLLYTPDSNGKSYCRITLEDKKIAKVNDLFNYIVSKIKDMVSLDPAVIYSYSSLRFNDHDILIGMSLYDSMYDRNYEKLLAIDFMHHGCTSINSSESSLNDRIIALKSRFPFSCSNYSADWIEYFMDHINYRMDTAINIEKDLADYKESTQILFTEYLVKCIPDIIKEYFNLKMYDEFIEELHNKISFDFVLFNLLGSRYSIAYDCIGYVLSLNKPGYIRKEFDDIENKFSEYCKNESSFEWLREYLDKLFNISVNLYASINIQHNNKVEAFSCVVLEIDEIRHSIYDNESLSGNQKNFLLYLFDERIMNEVHKCCRVILEDKRKYYSNDPSKNESWNPFTPHMQYGQPQQYYPGFKPYQQLPFDYGQQLNYGAPIYSFNQNTAYTGPKCDPKPVVDPSEQDLYNSMAGLSNNPTSSTTDKDIDIKNHVKE